MMALCFTVAAVIIGYHAYKEIWNVELDEELLCEREVGNWHDTFAVAMCKGSVTVGHVPRVISPICSIGEAEISRVESLETDNIHLT